MRIREIRPGWFFRRGDIYLANLNPYRIGAGRHAAGTGPAE